MSRRGRSGSPFSLFAFQDIITCVTAVIILITLMLIIELINRKHVSHVSDAAPAKDGPARELDAYQNEIRIAQEEMRHQSALVDEAATATPLHIERDVAALRAQLTQLADESVALVADLQRLRLQQHQDVRKHTMLTVQRLEELRGQLSGVIEQRAELKRQNRLFYNQAPGTNKQPWILEISAEHLLAARFDSSGPQLKQRWGRGQTAQAIAWTTRLNPKQDYVVLLVHPSGIRTFDALSVALENRGFEIGYDLLGENQNVLVVTENKQ